MKMPRGNSLGAPLGARSCFNFSRGRRGGRGGRGGVNKVTQL